MLALVVPALLVVVALVQVGRAHVLDQSSWSGAGFGMFATYDSGLTRFVLLEVERPDGTVETVPAPAGDRTTGAEVVPTAEALRALVEAVRDEVDGTVVGAAVWGIRFDAGASRVTPYLLARVDDP